MEFAKKYPFVAGRGRPIQAESDTRYSTSLQTYTRGEMATYSESTLRIYLDYIRQLQKEGRNLVYDIRNNTCKAMGYEDVEAAESQMEWRFT